MIIGVLDTNPEIMLMLIGNKCTVDSMQKSSAVCAWNHVYLENDKVFINWIFQK